MIPADYLAENDLVHSWKNGQVSLKEQKAKMTKKPESIVPIGKLGSSQ